MGWSLRVSHKIWDYIRVERRSSGGKVRRENIRCVGMELEHKRVKNVGVHRRCIIGASEAAKMLEYVGGSEKHWRYVGGGENVGGTSDVMKNVGICQRGVGGRVRSRIRVGSNMVHVI